MFRIEPAGLVFAKTLFVTHAQGIFIQASLFDTMVRKVGYNVNFLATFSIRPGYDRLPCSFVQRKFQPSFTNNCAGMERFALSGCSILFMTFPLACHPDARILPVRLSPFQPGPCRRDRQQIERRNES